LKLLELLRTGRFQCDAEDELKQPLVTSPELGVSSESPRLQDHGRLNYPRSMTSYLASALAGQRLHASIQVACFGGTFVLTALSY